MPVHGCGVEGGELFKEIFGIAVEILQERALRILYNCRTDTYEALPYVVQSCPLYTVGGFKRL